MTTKAKEYMEKHYDAIMLTGEHFDTPKTPEEKEALVKEIDRRQRKAIAAMLIDMNKEVTELGNRRGVKTNAGMVAILREMNDKWNAIADMMEQRFGSRVLLHDGFKNYWFNQMPEIKPLWDRR